MKIDFANLRYQHNLYKDEIENAILDVTRNCNFIMGKEVTQLEHSLESFTGVANAISCSSGTDALILAMLSIDIKPNDEIITTPFTFIATSETIALLGAKPVFIDIDDKTYNIDVSQLESKVTSKTKAIIAVSLYGQPPDIDSIMQIASKYNLKVIIDGAQSFGATYNGVMDSNLAHISCTSFFPAKPLGCYGDGGAVFTNDSELAEKIKSLRLHGQTKRYYHKYIGIAGRLDTIQAAVLNVKLKYYKDDLKLRQSVADKYSDRLKDKQNIVIPYLLANVESAWAQYSIRVTNRDALQDKLNSFEIPTAIHYPMSLHLQDAFRYLGYKSGDFPISEMVSSQILSLPMNPYLSDDELDYICEKI